MVLLINTLGVARAVVQTVLLKKIVTKSTYFGNGLTPYWLKLGNIEEHGSHRNMLFLHF